MSIEVKVPQLPESVSEATLVNWHKQPGDSVKRDENLVDLETDKVVLDVPAPADGVLKEIRIADGSTVTSGDVIAIFEEGEAGAEAEKAAPKEEPKAQAKPEPARAKSEEEPKERGKSAAKLSPSVRRLVEEHDLDPDAIEGSGRDGRLTKSDVMDYLERREESAPHEQAAPEQRAAAPEVRAQRGNREARRVPMTRLRARIAERMIESQSNAALLTSFNEIDLTKVIELRKNYRDKFEQRHGVRLGFQSFFIKAAIEALKQFPVVNASVEGTDIIYHDYWDIGIAVSTDRGLMVPILRDADQMSFAEIEQNVVDYAKKARDGKLSIDDLTGGTFTITNGGVFGSLMSTPIINPPQSAILGMHKIQERPMVVDGQIVARPMMYIAITYDHRIIDGREAVLFLVAIKEALEDPARLMLQI
ncbi:MAG TPA: 2-oxoglutarate dehydrogenase complex dihydrolipoyllysine-residue succinyltransferase [Gammaproteobacteria bacterium]|jgi:2-oxoglutarate dehydrogenase E2 component (dihydrolipoamide succinyltransferase)|nr:2-oxoglutarate dehydrogenase complex dihydrolipoyllysine-residue succinyltransferase [Gammaproteobacteria bacterium]